MSSYSRLPTQDDTDPADDAQVDKPPPPAPAPRRLIPALLCALFIALIFGFVFRKRYLPISPTSPPPQHHTPPPPKPSGDMAFGGRKLNVAYFVNWGIYGRKYPPSLIPAEDLTHILYAFANLSPASGEVTLSDKWADQDIHYPGDSWEETGLFGNLKQLYLLKKKHRHLKVLLSIGGWTYSPSFHPIVVSPHLRAKFVASSIKLLEDYGFDGLDIDYEYPTNDEQAWGYVHLLKELREGLDAHAARKGLNYFYPLTIAAPCGPQNYEKLHAREMDRYLTFWNLMAYDYSGSWENIANHQANVAGPPINTTTAVDWYQSQGVGPWKIIIGLPLYGRSFLATNGPGTPFTGIGPGTWEAGSYDYRVLPLPGSYMFRDEAAMAKWCYDYQRKEMVTFDDEEVARWKANWIKHRGLGGSMFWELSGDKGPARGGMEGGFGKDPQPGGSLVKIMKEEFGHLENSPNCLDYSQSQFENLRKGMQ